MIDLKSNISRKAVSPCFNVHFFMSKSEHILIFLLVIYTYFSVNYVYTTCLFFYWVLFYYVFGRVFYVKEVSSLSFSKCGLPPLPQFVNYTSSDWVVQPAYFLDEETEPKIGLGLVTFFGGGSQIVAELKATSSVLLLVWCFFHYTMLFLRFTLLLLPPLLFSTRPCHNQMFHVIL